MLSKPKSQKWRPQFVLRFTLKGAKGVFHVCSRSCHDVALTKETLCSHLCPFFLKYVLSDSLTHYLPGNQKQICCKANLYAFFIFCILVLSARAALGQVQPALEHSSLHWGHLPQEQNPLGGCQRLQPHLPRHRVLGVSYIRAHMRAHLHNRT